MLIAHAHVLYSRGFFSVDLKIVQANLQIYCTLHRYMITLFVAQTEDLRLAHLQQNPRIVRIHTLSLTNTNRMEGNCRKELDCEKQPYNSHDLYAVAAKRS